MTELLIFYITPAIISAVGVLVACWGTEEITLGDVLSTIVIVFVPMANLLSALLFIKLFVDEILWPMLTPLFSISLWRKKK